MPHIHPGPFIKFSASPWSEFLATGMKRSFPAQATILYPGDQTRYLYFVRQGEILTTHYFSAEDNFKVNVIGANAVAGIFELFSPFPPKASWHVLSPCICYLFTRAQVEGELPPSLMTNLLEQAALMGATMAERFTRRAGKRNDIRLARFLLHFAEAHTGRGQGSGPAITITPNVTQEISSELLGMHPVTFNKLLAAFRKLGIIGKSKKSGLEILDQAALARYADGEMPPLQ